MLNIPQRALTSTISCCSVRIKKKEMFSSERHRKEIMATLSKYALIPNNHPMGTLSNLRNSFCTNCYNCVMVIMISIFRKVKVMKLLKTMVMIPSKERGVNQTYLINMLTLQ